jgi:putative DNA-invertase from lambdoid prophage Rac
MIMKNAAIYCRVSTDQQDYQRQIIDLEGFCARAGYTVVGIFTETASGMKDNRIERNKVMKLAQARKIDAILVTEMTRWGRSTIDLLTTLKTLEAYGVSVVAQTGFQFDLTSPQGKLLAGILSSLSEFERDLISERTKSGLAAAKSKGKILGRPIGNKAIPKHRNAVKKFLEEGKTYRWISKELHIGKDTIMAIAKEAA